MGYALEEVGIGTGLSSQLVQTCTFYLPSYLRLAVRPGGCVGMECLAHGVRRFEDAHSYGKTVLRETGARHLTLKREPQRKLNVARIANCRGLTERRIRSRGIGPRSPRRVRDHVVAVIQQVKGLRHPLQLHAIGQRKGAAKPRIEIEEIESSARIAPNHPPHAAPRYKG